MLGECCKKSYEKIDCNNFSLPNIKTEAANEHFSWFVFVYNL